MKLTYCLSTFLIILTLSVSAQEKQYKVNTVAFYNVENLFDYEDDPVTFDDDRTPDGKDHWTKEIYEAEVYDRVMKGQ